MPWFMRETNVKCDSKVAPVTPEARCSFWVAYGVTPCEQIELERYYDKLVIGGFGEEWVSRPLFTERL